MTGSFALLGWLTSALIVVVSFVRFADWMRWRIVRRRLGDANAFGVWWSAVYPFIRGRIAARLPAQLVAGQVIEVSILAYYRIWSLYRPGSASLVSFSATVDPLGVGGNNSADPMALAISMNFKVIFAQLDGEPSQVIDYRLVGDDRIGLLVGGYRSDLPADTGAIILQRVR